MSGRMQTFLSVAVIVIISSVPDKAQTASDRTGTRQIIVFQTDGDQLRTLRSENEELGGTTKFTFDQIVALAKRKGVVIHTVYSGLDLSKLTKRERKEFVRKALEDERYAASLSSKRQVSESIPLKLTSDYLTSRAELSRRNGQPLKALRLERAGWRRRFVRRQTEAAISKGANYFGEKMPRTLLQPPHFDGPIKRSNVTTRCRRECLCQKWLPED